MHKVLRVKILEAHHELHSDQEHRLQSELVLAELKQLLEVRPHDRHDQHSVVALDAEPVHGRDARVPLQYLIDLRFVVQLWLVGLQVFLAMLNRQGESQVSLEQVHGLTSLIATSSLVFTFTPE